MIPTKNLVKPDRSRLLRDVDSAFLKRLTDEMEREPEGNYGMIFVLLKGITSKAAFNRNKPEKYEYEVLGGLHNTMAAKALLEKHPRNEHFQRRHARVYVGLTDKEALWLGTRHNATASFRHEIKLKEEVCHSHVQKMFIQRSNTLRERAVTKDFMRSDWLLEQV